MEHKITHGCAEIVYLLETGRAVNQDTFMSEYVVVFLRHLLLLLFFIISRV